MPDHPTVPGLTREYMRVLHGPPPEPPPETPANQATPDPPTETPDPADTATDDQKLRAYVRRLHNNTTRENQ